MIIPLALLIFSSASYSRDISVQQLDPENNPQAYSKKIFKVGNRQWPQLEDAVEATVKSSTKLYMLPDYMYPQNQPEDKTQREKVVCTPKAGASLQGEVLTVMDDMAAVRLNDPTAGCGQSVVFIPASSLTNIKASDNASEAGTGKTQCTSCKTSNRKALRDATSAVDSDVAEKMPDDQERYIRCYLDDSKNYDQYYKRLIELASQNFSVAYYPNGNESLNNRQLPVVPGTNYFDETSRPGVVSVTAKRNLMKCVIMRESLFDPTAESETGAVGLGQHVAEYVKDIRCRRYGCSKAKDGVAITKTPWVDVLWKRYMAAVEKEFPRAQNPELYRNPVTKKECSREMTDKNRDAPCPINSIAAIAVTQISVEIYMRDKSPLYKDSQIKDYNLSERLYMAVAATGSHNAGPTHAARAANSTITPEQWADEIIKQQKSKARNKEVGDYMQYMKNCLEKGNFGPINGVRARMCDQG